MARQRFLRFRQQVHAERQDDAVERFSVGRGVYEVLARDHSGIVLADRDVRILAFIGQRFQGAEGVGLDVHALLDYLDVHLGLFSDLLERLGHVASGRAERSARHHALNVLA